MTSFVATVDIHSLAEAQSYEELDAELQSNPSRINEHESGPNNKTVLHIAAEHLNLPMVEMLVKKYHANINERGYNGQFTALCFAVTLNDDDDDSDMGDDEIDPKVLDNRTSVVKFLLENGATPNVSGLEMNIRPLEWACQNQFVDIAELLVEHGADVNSRNEFGDVCLESLYSGEFCFQVTNEMLDITEILLDKGIDVNGWNGREGMPPLHHALSLLDCEELVLLLVSHGANVRADNQYGSNAFEVCLKKQGEPGVSLNTKMEQAYQVFCSTIKKDDADISVEGVEQE